jgi:hypothetical protein
MNTPGLPYVLDGPSSSFMWQLMLRNFRTVEQPGLCKIY